jgi:chaperonin GroEL
VPGSRGVRIAQRALLEPIRCIARNSGLNPDEVADRVVQSNYGFGLNARTGQFEDLQAAGVLDPCKVTATSLRNAASVAKLVLATRTLIADKPESYDWTSGPCRGGGAERFGMDDVSAEVAH